MGRQRTIDGEQYEKDESGDDIVFNPFHACRYCGKDAHICIFSLDNDIADNDFMYFCDNNCFFEYSKRFKAV